MFCSHSVDSCRHGDMAVPVVCSRAADPVSMVIGQYWYYLETLLALWFVVLLLSPW